MFNYLTHSILFPLTLPMYTQKIYKVFILLMWLYTLNILLLGTFIPADTKESDDVTFYRIACGMIPFFVSLWLISKIVYSKHYEAPEQRIPGTAKRDPGGCVPRPVDADRSAPWFQTGASSEEKDSLRVYAEPDEE